MVRHCEVRITSRSHSARKILELCLRFARDAEGWKPHPNGLQSGDCLLGHHCVVVHSLPPVAGISLVQRATTRRAVELTNVFPRDQSWLPPDEFNVIVRRFVNALRAYIRDHGYDLSVSQTSRGISLRSAIPSPKCRSLFEKYLRFHPRSFHQCDLDRLHQFVHAAHRHHAKVDLELLAAHLIRNLSWPSADVHRVVDRVRVGLEVLDYGRRCH